MKITFYIILITVVLFSCVPKQSVKKELPIGNLSREIPDDTLNTKKNDLAPIQIPSGMGNSAVSLDREMKSPPLSGNKVVSSRVFFEKLFQDKDYSKDAIDGLTKNLESITLTTDTTGFVSFSQPISDRFAERKGLAIGGNVGGTDIFSLGKNSENEFQFRNLPEPVNSIFWDSHPFAARDTFWNGKIRTLLVWASDRESPFVRFDTNALKTNEPLNINLYYAFLDEGGNVLKYDTLKKINTSADEITPFIYCICCQPKLMFATNRKSKSDFSKKEDFDIYYSEVKIDFTNMNLEVTSEPQFISQVYHEKGDIPSINSYFNEVFPFVPNPAQQGESNSLYFSSDRFRLPYSHYTRKFIDTASQRECPCEESHSDSLTQNIGGYDFYRFKLPAEFRCEPPPPPVLYMTAKVKMINFDTKNDTVSVDVMKNQKISIRQIPQHLRDEYISLLNNQYIIKDSISLLDDNQKQNKALKSLLESKLKMLSDSLTRINQTLPGASFYQNAVSDKIYKSDVNSVFVFTMEQSGSDCIIKSCSDAILVTPKIIYANDTLSVEIICHSKPRNPRPVNFSYSKGLSFFVTGYWWPTTNENFAVLNERLDKRCLEKSNFIDLEDYDYAAAAKMNSEYLEKEFVHTIDSVLKLLDTCYRTQTLRITIYGMTDPCRLRPTENEERTLYTCDPEINFMGQTVIKPGTRMKYPNLVDISGKPMEMPNGSQNGNYLLAMLRSYYTMKTIDRLLSDSSEAYRSLRNNGNLYEVFDLHAVGIDNINTQCPGTWYNFVKEKGMENFPLIPEECNKPYSRRVMIYADIVNIEDVKKGFAVSQCGDRNIRQNIKTVIADIPLPEIKSEEIFTGNLKDLTAEKKDPGCPGPPCYFWLEFGVAENMDQAKFIVELLNKAGIKDVVIDDKNPTRIEISTQQFTSRNEVEAMLVEYQKILSSKLKPLVEELKLKLRMKF